MKSRGTFLVAVAMLASVQAVSLGALIGVTPDFPVLAFDSTGVVSYDAGDGLLSINALPIVMRFGPASFPRFVNPTGIDSVKKVSIMIQVDQTGTLIGGVPGDDLIVAGEVDEDGDGVVDFDGVLLTGEISEFGFLESGTSDRFDFRFTVTGGTLAPLYFGQDIGVTTTSEGSTFADDFTIDFDGGAKGNIGPIPASCVLDVQKTCSVRRSGDDCRGKVVEMIFEYTGELCDATTNDQEGKATCMDGPGAAAPVQVVVTRDEDRVTVSPSGLVILVGDLITFTATDGNLRSSTEFDLLDGSSLTQSLAIHTSCSKALSVSDQFGSVRLVQLTTTQGGTVGLSEPTSECTIEAFPTGTSCDRKLKALTLRYEGGDCTETTQDQAGKFECAGDAGIIEPIRIIVREKEGSDRIFLDTGEPANVRLGDVVVAAAANAGKKHFKSSTYIEVIDEFGTLLQVLEIHTSCSKPLRLDDRFGSLRVLGFDSKRSGLVAVGAFVEYTYVVTNGNPFDVVVDVDDSELGRIAEDLTITSGESATLVESAFIAADTTNVVTVSGEPCPDVEASATVTVVERPTPTGSCDVGKPKALVFEYTGDSCDATTNDQEGRAECTDGPGGAEPVEIVVTRDEDKVEVSSPTPQIFVGDFVTFTATDRKLKASLEFDIVHASGLRQSLAIHTSCSKPLAIGDQFGGMILREFVPEQRGRGKKGGRRAGVRPGVRGPRR